MNSNSPKHRFVISLGSNTDAERHIFKALSVLRLRLTIEGESPVVNTEPVDFPYPTGWFTNVVLVGSTTYTREELVTILHQIEQEEGRDRTTPEQVRLDADLIMWDSEVLKPKDLQRPYFKELLDKACTGQI